MQPAFPTSDYYESSASPSSIGATFPFHLSGLSPVHMSDSNALVRLPVAVFVLACGESIQARRSSYALRVIPCRTTTSTSDNRVQFHTYDLPWPVFHLLSRVGEGDAFSPQTRINRFVFLNLPTLSLEVHLGLTTSPHTPFPAGYVTLPMCNRSPPLRLSLAHSSKRAFGSFFLLS
jgi:hypothetical protein